MIDITVSITVALANVYRAVACSRHVPSLVRANLDTLAGHIALLEPTTPTRARAPTPERERAKPSLAKPTVNAWFDAAGLWGPFRSMLPRLRKTLTEEAATHPERFLARVEHTREETARSIAWLRARFDADMAAQGRTYLGGMP